MTLNLCTKVETNYSVLFEVVFRIRRALLLEDLFAFFGEKFLEHYKICNPERTYKT
jgi:hypothetical protein